MDPNDLRGCYLLAALLGNDASVTYVRGVAHCEATEVVVKSDDGRTYMVPYEVASTAMRVDAAVRAAAPATFAPMLLGVEYMVLVPPADGDYAIARTPGWKGHLATGGGPPNDESER